MSFNPLNKSVREEILFTDDETQAEKNKVAKIQTQAVYPQKLMLLTSSLWGHYFFHSDVSTKTKFYSKSDFL